MVKEMMMRKRERVNKLMVGCFAKKQRTAVMAVLTEDGKIALSRTQQGRPTVNGVPLSLNDGNSDMYAGYNVLLNIIERVFGSVDGVSFGK
jgi:hypothetical protein